VRLFHTWREQQEAKADRRLGRANPGVMLRRQADARTELFFSTELLTKFAGAEPRLFQALRKLKRDRLIFTDHMTDRCILTNEPLLKR
jgi:hypothetical protein